jgi:ERCC4-related helicase
MGQASSGLSSQVYDSSVQAPSRLFFSFLFFFFFFFCRVSMRAYDQRSVINRFRSNKYNLLFSTKVGAEGIDIQVLYRIEFLLLIFFFFFVRNAM